METKQNTLIEKLFSVGAHFGYAPSRRHPSVARFIFGTKGGVELFDLERTAQCMDEALEVVKKLASERKSILFVSGKAESREPLRRAADRIGQPYVASRWIGGTLTNFSEIKKRIARLSDLSSMREKGELSKLTKYERLLIDREIDDLEAVFGGLKGMPEVPDALFVVDPKHEIGAVREAHQLKIPVFALLNTDCDKRYVTYPIPANDASIQSVTFILDEVSKAYELNVGTALAPVAPVAAQQ